MKFLKNKGFLLLFIYFLPMFLDHKSNTSEELVWLIYLIPSIFLPFHFGIKGGIVAAILGTLAHANHEIVEILKGDMSSSIENIFSMILVTVIYILVALMVGFLVEKLRTEQSSMQTVLTKMENMAYLDHLTGLPNRWNAEIFLKKALEDAQKSQQTLAVIFIDLDRFKLINDGLGRAIGDQLLKEVAIRLAEHTQKEDFLARQGGDEFILFLTDPHAKKDVQENVSAIHKLIQTPFEINGQEYFISSSIGISLFPDDGTTCEELIQHADIAMYSAKEVGKNGFQFYATDKLQEINDVVKIEGHLRKALLNNEFTLHFQPLVNLTNGKIFGMEALIRWHSLALGNVSPAVFIPLAEEIGVICKLGEWVLKEACTQAKAISNLAKNPFRVAVNISSKQFRDPNFVQIVRDVLQETGLEPEQLELEITESVSLENIDKVILKLKELKALGITIALDDFGTGYSSISYLKYLPIDTLKIDQSFVKNMLHNLKDRALVESVISLSKSFGFHVTAEGVEQQDQLELLREFHCGQAQGYLFSKPVPINDFYSMFMRYQQQHLFRTAINHSLT